MSTTEIFLIAMLVIFTLPYLIWRYANFDYFAPLVIVQIIGGVLLGPGVLGAVFPDYYHFVFTQPVVHSLNGLAWWGVMIFVMIAGIELDLKLAWNFRRESLVTAGLSLGVPLALGCLAAVVLLGQQGWIGPKGMNWQFILGIGMACAVTALPVLVLLLEKLEMLRLPIGQRILRYASLDDVAIWGVLAIILLDWERVGRQLGFLLVFALVTIPFRKGMLKAQEKDRWYFALVWLILCALGADWAGLHFMVGAFLAGVVMDASWFNQEKMDQFRHNILLAVMPVFFLSTGLKTNWGVGGYAVFYAAGLLVLVSVGGKLLAAQAAGRILGWRAGEASIIGWLLQSKGLIEIVFANILLDKQIITNDTFTALLLMAVASTMLTVPMVAPKLAAGVAGSDELKQAGA
ncbi:MULTISPECIES: cation:proton antiporter [unclassified Duganella]|uniref:cation:proton antiporter n=1 Tax=unclassified Duganella TaxID=2636909 RepID=UPI0007002040|nr:MULTISPECIES: cation:proton antiporter [unclassified Duganella]KQV61881.1 sodium:proton exchanger [Duganella sp. Root336D2]KRB84390.1 sodium:proton exchanger [Duganella sp. Root198D2]